MAAFALVGATNLLNALAGWNGPNREQVSFVPPDAVVGVVWTVLFVLIATARWRALRGQSDTRARRSADLLALLLLACAIYPSYTLALDSDVAGLVGNLATLGLAAYAIDQVRRSAPGAARFAFPVLLWLSFACVVTAGDVIVQNS